MRHWIAVLLIFAGLAIPMGATAQTLDDEYAALTTDSDKCEFILRFCRNARTALDAHASYANDTRRQAQQALAIAERDTAEAVKQCVSRCALLLR